MSRFVRVALNIPNESYTYSYQVIEDVDDDILMGRRVMVSFGGRLMEGYIVEVLAQPDIDPDRIKPIMALLDYRPMLDSAMLHLARWISDKYLCSLGAALECILPSSIGARVDEYVVLRQDPMAVDNLNDADMKAVIELLKQNDGRMKLAALKRAVLIKNISQVLSRLEQKGAIAYDYSIKEGIRSRKPALADQPVLATSPPELAPQQENAVVHIKKAVDSGNYSLFLIHGVTGSGKTEVYLRCIQHVLDKGMDAIVLVPEISLTPQMVSLFVGRFGQKVAVWHSRLSKGEKCAEWWKIKDGQCRVVIGARSAVFAPVRRLGLIVVDEEQESSYKSDMTPKYDAREVAQQRCLMAGSVLVLGSATPSLETYYQAVSGKIKLLSMPYRINSRSLPKVEIVDMREEIAAQNKSIFSRQLLKAMEYNLKIGDQTILFINRRGFSTFVSCRSCGLVMKCRHCDISLVYHWDQRELQCHYCGYKIPVPKTCPGCGSMYIRYFGAGTQRIEQEARRLFPQARILRMDADTTARKNAHKDMVLAVLRHEVDILVGTQMIAKGLDFPDVTLVGVVAADTALNLPDFRSAEDTFQLVTQVAGRAGRGCKPGRVIVQTYQPEHYSLQAAINHDYNGFFQQEIAIRQRFHYPPFSSIVKISITGKNLETVIKKAQALFNELHGYIDRLCYNNIETLGPSPAPMEKVRDQFRWQIILKVDRNVLNEIRYDIKRIVNRYAGISMDIDPYSML